MGGIESSVGRPVRGINFFGREREQRLLWQHLETSHVLLLAPRRVGKTSLLLRLMDTASEHNLKAVYVSVADARNEDDVVRKLIAALATHPGSPKIWKRLQKGPFKRFIGRLIPTIAAGPLSVELEKAAPEEGWPKLAEAIAEAIAAVGEPWVILVDELPIFVLNLLRQDGGPDGAVVRTRHFLNWFRHLRNPTHGGAALRWVVAGSIGLDAVVARARLGDTINDLSLVPLGPFSPEVADDFLEALADSYGVALSAETRLRLCERAGWLIPFYLQVLFSRLHDLVAETGLTPSPTLVDRVVDELLTPAYRAYFDYWRQRLTEELGRPDDQRALTLLACVAEREEADRDALEHALSEFVPEPTERQRALTFLLEVLENDGYLTSDALRGPSLPFVSEQKTQRTWRFRSALLREYWLRRVL